MESKGDSPPPGFKEVITSFTPCRAIVTCSSTRYDITPLLKLHDFHRQLRNTDQVSKFPMI